MTKVNELASLAALKALQSIKCRITQVSDLAPLAGLRALQSIDCRDTRISDLVPLAGLTALEAIDCSYTEVGDLTSLVDLNRLQSLDCSYTQVKDLRPLAELKALCSIDCTNTQVSELAPLTNLQTLESIRCAWTRVRDVTPLATLQGLRSLSCFNTQVHDLAPLADLPVLESIDCSRTEVSDLGPVENLPALQRLDCSFTRVRTLMPLARAASLREVTCNGLELEDTSTPYLHLPSLQKFACWQTRIFSAPAEVLSQGWDDNCLLKLRAHFEDLAEGSVESRDVKLMVLGNGCVGKTQLCRRLQGLPYDDALPSTHGIVVESFELPCRGGTDFASVHIWDFGGQDIYHGTHALFLRANAVFVLAWAPEFEIGEQMHGGLTFRNYPLRYWVDYVRHLGNEGPAVLVVQTRCDHQRDRRPCAVDDEALGNAFGSGYFEVLQFSALNDRGLAGLQEKLSEAIEFLREAQGVARIGASRHRVKARLETLQDEDAKLPHEQRRSRWLTQEEFRRICAEAILLSEPEFLLDYLHNTGVVFYREGLFDDRIILDQGWALEAIYAVFNRESCLRQLRQLRGRFTRPLLGALVWSGRQEGEQKLLIGMMRSCGISFQVREEDHEAGIEAEYIAPDLLPDRAAIQTELDALWNREGPTEQATYAYDLLLPGLLRALTSGIGSQAGVSALYWRDGLCVYEASTGAHALIEQAMDAGWSGRLTVSTRGGRARELLTRLQGRVESIQEHLGLRPNERDGGSTADFARWGRLRDVSENVPDMRFATAPRTAPRWFVSYAWNDATDPERESDVDRICAAAEARGTLITRDKSAMNLGDSISRFMKDIGQGDRVFVFLSDKYLKSPFCMFELFEIWRNSHLNNEEFRRKVRIYRLPDATIFSTKERLAYASYWRAQYDELAAELRRTDPGLLGERDFRAFRLMQDFAHHVGDILALFADTLLPRTFQDFLKFGFDELPQ
jgi:internalin A